MLIRTADFVAHILHKNSITDIFSLVGGGAMFLNDAFAHFDELNVIYNQHEQSCAMAAEGYVRASGKMAAVCVTSGPGGTNAITGVLGAYQDNYPMLVISGQVRLETHSASTGLPLRFMGEQEHNIVDTVKPMTKYAVMVTNPKDIRYELEKAIFLANNSRKGPCWVDIPLDVQGALIDANSLHGYVSNSNRSSWNKDVFLSEIASAKKPVLLAGSALRSSGCVNGFKKLTAKLNIPILTATYNADIMPVDHPLYFGNFGVIGGRAGNFIVQNADLIVGMGCRMTFRQIGFNYQSFNPTAKKMIVDIDENELIKPTLKIDIPICANIKDVVEDLITENVSNVNPSEEWLSYCRRLKNCFPVYLDKFNSSEVVNPYYFVKKLKSFLSNDSVLVLGNSSIAGHVLQMGITESEQRIINNMNCGSMGYDLPAAIGAAIAIRKEVTLLTGDGSIMLNIQELLTITHYRLPIKIFIFSNQGYRAIYRTQQNMFNGRYAGCTPETGMPVADFSKIAKAFGFPYIKIDNHECLFTRLREVYDIHGYVICEVLQDLDQAIEPRVQSRKLDDGTLVSPSIDDMYPFLDEKAYQDMQIKILL